VEARLIAAAIESGGGCDFLLDVHGDESLESCVRSFI